ncbi:hypothetical protein AAFL38_24475 [Klebsiella grimontii]|uniref:Uncharacterized protein n=1 Tax=Klebsiella grimontii TaxID=2058152 RepID=A0ABU9P2M1_9ENTR|nr:hypothetical protein [Klebsiella grimontii]MDU6358083.1 hypothetical protein [Klebsiella grimontii]MDU6531022.1 hypothetical protein [Klebsiella grimontii]MDU7684761.1 hypothetical protein [Klebsiella grimontii]
MRRRDLLRSIALSPLVLSVPSKGKEGFKPETAPIECPDNKNSVTPEMFGARPDGIFNNKEAIEKALRYAYLNGMSCTFLKGMYYSDDISLNVPVKINITSGSYLNFELSIAGSLFSAESNSRIKQGWKSFSTGTNTFSNKNLKINKGDVVSVSLDYQHGGSSQFGNENGIDILNVIDVNESNFIVKNGTRFPYTYPIISKLKSVVAFKGGLHKGSYTIAGNFTSKFSSGDVIRIENVDGTDSVGSGKNYFEYVKIKSIDENHLILSSRTIYSHLNPWLIRTSFLNEVDVTGQGRIKKLVLRNINDLKVSSLSIDRLIISNCYGINVNNLNLTGLSEPSTVNITYCFGKSIVQNLKIANSESSSDNSSLKVMSSPQIVLSNIVISDSNSYSNKQSNYSLFVDALYTPYSCWNDNIILSNIICERPRSNFKRGIWFYGLRNSVIESIVGADVFLQGSVDCFFNNFNISEYKLETKDLVRCNLSFKCQNAIIRGGIGNMLKLDFGGPSSDDSPVNGYCCKFTKGTVNPETGTRYIRGDNNHLNFNNLTRQYNGNGIEIEFQNDLTIESMNVSFLKVKNHLNIGKEVSNVYVKSDFQKI